MKRQTILLGFLLWGGTMGLAYYAGTQWTPPQLSLAEPTIQPLEPGIPSPQPSPTSPIADRPGLPPTDVAAVSLTTTPANSIELLRSSLREADPVARIKQLLQSLEGLNPDNVEAFAEEFKGMTGPRDGQLLTYFIHQWASFDPEGALAFASARSDRQSMWLTSMALRSWGSNDPEAALQYLDETGEADENGFYLPGVISGWAANDPLAAARYVAELDDPRVRQRALTGIAREMASMDMDQIMTYWNSIYDQTTRNELLPHLTSQLARAHPEQSLRLLNELDPEMANTRAVNQLVGGWVDNDPEAAASFVKELPDSALRSEAIATLVNRWSRRDPVEAGLWLNQFPPSAELDEAVVQYVNRVERSDPEGALTWADSITDPETRDRMLREISGRWWLRDADSAQDFLQASDSPAELKEAVRARQPGDDSARERVD